MSRGKKIIIFVLNILIIAAGLIAVTAISRVEVAVRLQESPVVEKETRDVDVNDVTVKSNVIDVFNDPGTSGESAEGSEDYAGTDTYEDNSDEDYTNDYSGIETDTDTDNDNDNDADANPNTPEPQEPVETDGDLEPEGGSEPADGPEFSDDNDDTSGGTENSGN